MFHRYPSWLVIAWSAAAALLPWLLQAAPAWRDGPEFVVAPWVLGISHPAGFPLYQALVWLAEQLPLGDVALRSHAFSAILSLISAILLYHLTLLFQSSKDDHSPSRAQQHIAGWVSLSWLAMPAQLENAIQAEAYSLFAAFTFIICILLLRFQHTGERKYFIIAAFLAGIGCGNHIMLGVFLFPLIIVLATHSDFSEAIKTAVSGLIAGLWGLLIYAYLPVRSLREPSFDWGNPETLQAFVHLVTDKKDSGARFSSLTSNDSTFMEPLIDHMGVLLEWLGPIGLSIIFFGWFLLLAHRTHLALTHLSWVLFLFIFFMGWTSNTVLTGALGMLLIGAAMVFADLSKFKGKYLAFIGKGTATILACIIFLNIYNTSIQFLAKRADYLPSELVRAQLLALPYRATIFAGRSWFHLRSLTDIEGLRPDVTIIGLGDIISPQYFRPLLPHHIPLLTYPSFPIRQDGTQSDQEKGRFISELIAKNSDHSQLYLEMNADHLAPFNSFVAPSGETWWAPLATSPTANNCQKISSSFTNSLSGMLKERSAITDPQFADFIQPSFFAWSKLALLREPPCPNTARGMLSWWNTWLSSNHSLRAGGIENQWGILFIKAGNLESARRMFQLSASMKHSDGISNLGIWHANHGNISQAIAMFKKDFLLHGTPRSYRIYRRLMRENHDQETQ